MNLRSFDLVLFALYTVASVAGLITIKLWLPVAQIAWRSGSFVTGATGFVLLGAFLLHRKLFAMADNTFPQ